MSKLLYITDQQEYTDHGTIGPLFHGYLKRYMEVHCVYFTRFKDSFQCKGDDLIVPESEKASLIDYLTAHGIHLAVYDFIFVRNDSELLKQVLKAKERFGYRVGFRLSFPKTAETYEKLKARTLPSFFASMRLKRQLRRKGDLINRCDVFLPSSRSMAAAFYPDITTRIHPLPAGIDPAEICTPAGNENGICRFIYVGGLDALRQFDVVLDAFDGIDTDKWHLDISTFNPDFLHTLLAHYPRLQNNISIRRAKTLKELREIVRRADIGLALLPPIPLYATSLPAKVLDYYSCGLPALLTDVPKNRIVLGNEGACFAPFDTAAIKQKLNEMIGMSKNQRDAMAEKGLDALFDDGRRYDRMAKKIFELLESSYTFTKESL